MNIKSNNRGNGYIITGGSSRKRQKLILKIMSDYLHEYPGQSINISLQGNEILVDLQKNNCNQNVLPKRVKKY